MPRSCSSNPILFRIKNNLVRDIWGHLNKNTCHPQVTQIIFCHSHISVKSLSFFLDITSNTFSNMYAEIVVDIHRKHVVVSNTLFNIIQRYASFLPQSSNKNTAIFIKIQHNAGLFHWDLPSEWINLQSSPHHHSSFLQTSSTSLHDLFEITQI